MSEEFKNAFINLNINEKRNQINKELAVIGKLIETYEQNCGLESSINVKNYNINNNSFTESESLLLIYENIYEVEKELIRLLSNIAN